MSSISKINELITKYELTENKEYIHRNIKKSIHLTLAAKNDYSTPGVSRVGGYPDTSPGFIWPCSKDGQKMTFIAQLNLEDISKADELDLLPESGMLYFFMGLDDPGYNIKQRLFMLRM